MIIINYSACQLWVATSTLLISWVLHEAKTIPYLVKLACLVIWLLNITETFF